jgi:hypothetical protein
MSLVQQQELQIMAVAASAMNVSVRIMVVVVFVGEWSKKLRGFWLLISRLRRSFRSSTATARRHNRHVSKQGENYSEAFHRNKKEPSQKGLKKN